MAKIKKPGQPDEFKRQELIKKLAIIAMFADDELMERLVLKGGNAVGLLYQVTTRASVDVDFSMESEFGTWERAGMLDRIEKTLRDTFRTESFEVFDVKMTDQPKGLTADVADFWGGYSVEFKVIEKKAIERLGNNLEELRRNALRFGQGGKFLIDISKFEYTAGKRPVTLDGFRVFVYTPEMIACEKLRAICQQMPEYAPVVKRNNRPGSSRARDFVDIHGLVTEKALDLTLARNRSVLKHIFEAKRVPLPLLRQIASVDVREFHRLSFGAIAATVNAGVTLEAFDYYFDFVVDLVKRLEPLGDV